MSIGLGLFVINISSIPKFLNGPYRLKTASKHSIKTE